jgi:hypothetical protein
MSTSYTRRPSQFRLPGWAHEFLAQEAERRGVTKTDVVLIALEELQREQFEARLAQEYRENAGADLEVAAEWDATIADGLESEEW